MNQQLVSQVLACPRLPSLPAVLVEVIHLCRREDAGLRDLAGVIAKDAVLSAKVLESVNSAHYGVRQRVSTVSHAVNLLGRADVKMLALGYGFVHSFQQARGTGLDLQTVWQRSLHAAVAAQALGQMVTPLKDPEEVFLSGLLQDVGMIGLLAVLEADYAKLVHAAGARHEGLRELERQHLQVDHCEVGEAMAMQWRLPTTLIDPIRHHEEPEQAPASSRLRVRLVALGAKVADVFLETGPQLALRRCVVAGKRWLGLKATDIVALLEQVQEQSAATARLFELPVMGPDAVNGVLAEAKELLLDLSMQTQRDVVDLKRQKQELTRDASLDQLTRIANRGAFNKCLCRHFNDAVRDGKALSLIMLDYDHFKEVNDQNGHLVGDQVLKAIALVLVNNSPKGALVARLGGEELAVVVPGTDRQEAFRVAEHLRQAIERTVVETVHGRTVSVTASFGVATYDEADQFQLPVDLMRAADEAVYAAKDAGRNCVRAHGRQPSTGARQAG